MNNTPDTKQPGAQPAKKGTHRLPVILSKELQAYVEALSVQDHISISEVIRRALRRDQSLRRLNRPGFGGGSYS